MELDPTAAQHFVPPPYDAGFPFGTTGMPSHPAQAIPPHPGHPTHRSSPVSAGSENLSWAGQGPSMPTTPFHIPDGNPLDLELDAHVGDAMSRYVEMSMSMAGMGADRGPDSRPPTGGSSGRTD